LSLAVPPSVTTPLTFAGSAFSVAVGFVVSTFHVKDAGDASTLPAVSVARTSKVCVPSPRPVSERGLVHATNAPPSRLHWNVPASFELNWNAALVELLHAGGCESIVVCGFVLSTMRFATTSKPVLPAASVATARKS
jgi:hypothetical protein